MIKKISCLVNLTATNVQTFSGFKEILDASHALNAAHGGDAKHGMRGRKAGCGHCPKLAVLGRAQTTQEGLRHIN